MDKISYLKGLLAGLDFDQTSKEGKVFAAICDALDEMKQYTEELEDRIMELEELCDILDEDLGDIEEILFDDDCDCDCCKDKDDADDIYYEVTCPTCGDTIHLDDELISMREIDCPNCGEKLEFDLEG